MAEVFSRGPASYVVSAAVTAGQVVMADASNAGLIKPATAAATTVIGVARDDAAPAGSGSSTNYGTLRPEVAVFSAPHEVKVTAFADVLFGQKVIVGTTAGTVTPGVVAGQVVGYCTEPGGILAGNSGRIKLV